jgi:pyridoxine 5-phosphate synthase
MPTLLSVNLNKICLLRNSRGGDEPNLDRAARICVAAGAHGLTLHPRPDRRHATLEDCLRLSQRDMGVELNLEGNPFAEPEPGYPGFIEICRHAKPTQATLVPDSRGQLTSDQGFRLERDADALRPLIAALNDIGCRVSLFMDAESHADFAIAKSIGAARIELYTGPYAEAFDLGDGESALTRYRIAAAAAIAAGLGVNAGHDLNLENLAAFAQISGLLEVSIGHALIGDALYLGLEETVKRYLIEIKRGNECA